VHPRGINFEGKTAFRMKLSVTIPVYNFADFLPETIASIMQQDRVGEVEVLVVDGASTDSTPDVMGALCAKHPNLSYHRLPEKGGIDRDMAKAVELSRGEYCWLFSGDDVMSPGALAAALNDAESGYDIYIVKHLECFGDMTPIRDYPVLEPDIAAVFDLSDSRQRLEYFKRARNSEAFFSFMGGLIVNRAAWNRGTLNPNFVGSYFAHSARFFHLMRSGLTLKYTARVGLSRRGENDSFAHKGLIDRHRIQFEGYYKIVNTFFGSDSEEAREVRRAIRNEFDRGIVMNLKVLSHYRPEVESKQLLDHLVAIVYSDFSVAGQVTKLLYKWLTDASCPASCQTIFEPP
jgi:abequosyltransferase